MIDPTPAVTVETVEADPVGSVDIAVRLGVRQQTVSTWRTRGTQVPLPEPRWTVSGIPVWNWPDIAEWADRSGRAAPAPVEPIDPTPELLAPVRRRLLDRLPEPIDPTPDADLPTWDTPATPVEPHPEVEPIDPTPPEPEVNLILVESVEPDPGPELDPPAPASLEADPPDAPAVEIEPGPVEPVHPTPARTGFRRSEVEPGAVTR